MQLALCDVSDVVVFEIETTFSGLNDGRGIRTKNSMGWGRSSSDMNVRNWGRMILGLIIRGARMPAERPSEVAVCETENCVRKRIDSLEGINRLTRIGNLFITLPASEFNVKKIDLELLIGVHADQRREPRRAVTTSSGWCGFDPKTTAKDPSSSLKTALTNSVNVIRLLG